MEVCAMVSLWWQFYNCLTLFPDFREYKNNINNETIDQFVFNRFKHFDNASYQTWPNLNKNILGYQLFQNMGKINVTEIVCV